MMQNQTAEEKFFELRIVSEMISIDSRMNSIKSIKLTTVSISKKILRTTTFFVHMSEMFSTF